MSYCQNLRHVYEIEYAKHDQFVCKTAIGHFNMELSSKLT